MKKNLILYTLGLSVLILGSCRKSSSLISQDGAVDTVQIVNDLKASPSFNKYMLFTVRLQRGLLTDKYNLNHATISSLNQIASHHDRKPISQIAADMTKAGVDNAREFVFYNINRRNFYQIVKKEFPALQKLTPKERQKIFKAAFYSDPKHKKNNFQKLLVERKLTQAQRIQTQHLN
ncbi:MAG: hypothetical protein ABIN91_10390 [Mucilaginibacter sp.]|uniref:hypothetical protein n=1 Tax=Mucilaginibacter sp. TaxID=1882438 RepID=UPI003262F450